MKSFGESLAVIIQRKKITRPVLAKKAGIAPSHLGNILHNRGVPSIKVLVKLVKELKPTKTEGQELASALLGLDLTSECDNGIGTIQEVVGALGREYKGNTPLAQIQEDLRRIGHAMELGDKLVTGLEAQKNKD